MNYSVPVPSSPAQRLSMMPGSKNHIHTFWPRAQMSIKEIQHILKQVVEEFDCLRSTASEDGRFLHVHPSMKLDFHVAFEHTDHSHLTHSFSFQTGPFYRFQLVQKDDSFQLHFAAHEILWCDPIFKDVLETIEKRLMHSDPTTKMIHLWESVMGIRGIRSEDNFFKLGGHSLLAAELAEKIREDFNKEISMRDIFECPTVRALVDRLESLHTGNVVINSSSKFEAPVSFNQMQVWYVEELFPGTRMHNLATSLRMRWKVRPHLLKEAMHRFFDRHDALRTVIINELDGPIQRILPKDHPVFRPDLEVVMTTEEKVMGLMRQETEINFDKRFPPLFRAKLYMLGPSDYIFFFMAHHAIWDGWCFDIFFEELNILYSALERGMEPVFSRHPEVTYLEFSEWQREALKQGEFVSQMEYWKTKLSAPLPILNLPFDFIRPEIPTHDGALCRFSLTQKEKERLCKFASQKQMTLYQVLLTAFKITLSRYSGQKDIIVGSPIRGRNLHGLQQTIGHFVNVLALRTHIDPDLPFSDNLKSVYQTCLEGFYHQDLPFEIIAKHIHHRPRMDQMPIYQSYFSYQDMSRRQFSINGRPIIQVCVNNASVKTDLDMWISHTSSDLEGSIVYRPDLFQEKTIRRFIEDYKKIIRSIPYEESETSRFNQIWKLMRLPVIRRSV